MIGAETIADAARCAAASDWTVRLGVCIRTGSVTGAREKEASAWIGAKSIPYPPAWKRPQTIAIAYARAGAGEVFSWGNTGFLKSIASAGYGVPAPERAALDRAALNVWQRFTR